MLANSYFLCHGKRLLGKWLSAGKDCKPNDRRCSTESQANRLCVFVPVESYNRETNTHRWTDILYQRRRFYSESSNKQRIKTSL